MSAAACSGRGAEKRGRPKCFSGPETPGMGSIRTGQWDRQQFRWFTVVLPSGIQSNSLLRDALGMLPQLRQTKPAHPQRKISALQH